MVARTTCRSLPLPPPPLPPSKVTHTKSKSRPLLFLLLLFILPFFVSSFLYFFLSPFLSFFCFSFLFFLLLTLAWNSFVVKEAPAVPAGTILFIVGAQWIQRCQRNVGGNELGQRFTWPWMKLINSSIVPQHSDAPKAAAPVAVSCSAHRIHGNHSVT